MSGPMQYGAPNHAGGELTSLDAVRNAYTLHVQNLAATGGSVFLSGGSLGLLSRARANNGVGIYGFCDGPKSTGIWGRSTGGFAGVFDGAVRVTGFLTKSAGGFRIDHPNDPENKYLTHSFVESPDMLNIYSGNVVTDVNGDAVVKVPDYFEELNHDFRYQLTVIGQFAQAIVAETIRGNQFALKTDHPNVTVSWQVTGIRKDAYAKIHPMRVEEDKPEDERGTYLHPEAYGQPETQGTGYARANVLQNAEQEDPEGLASPES
jgi:hypothetical protein